MVIIKSVDVGSLGEQAGILAQDVLVSINGNEINDVLDYRFYLASSRLSISIMRDGERLEVSLKKGTYDDIGLSFDTPLMDKKHRCANNCLFCFIDQNPCGMRETVYFKDDDSRLSFLQGNYITLTNLFEKDVERIIKMRISPVRVSVHTTDPELRVKMMKNKRSGEVLSYLKRFADAGLELNAQIVLCRGINDGEALARTMSDLEKYIPSLTSVSIVPAGLTKHREGLYPLSLFSPEESAAVIRQINAFGDKCLEKYGARTFFCADEFYINAGLELPRYEYYEDFSQIESGVGMIRSFEDDFNFELEELKADKISLPRRVSVATGVAAYGMISGLCEKLNQLGLEISVHKIINNFYGESVTVSGLLTGGDIAEQLKDKDLGELLLIPANALRVDDNDFLDGMTLDELKKALNIDIIPCGSDGAEFLHLLAGI